MLLHQTLSMQAAKQRSRTEKKKCYKRFLVRTILDYIAVRGAFFYFLSVLRVVTQIIFVPDEIYQKQNACFVFTHIIKKIIKIRIDA